MEKIILYSTNCPLCKKLEVMLNSHNIKFEKNTDIEMMKILGFSSSPMLKIHDKYLNFYESKKWIEDFEKNGAI